MFTKMWSWSTRHFENSPHLPLPPQDLRCALTLTYSKFAAAAVQDETEPFARVQQSSHWCLA